MTRLLILFLTISACTPSRKIDTGTEFKQAYRPAYIPAALSLVSGACYGVHETVVHHPGRIPEGWNSRFWDNRESWKNKYRNGDPGQGAAYFGSTTFLAWTTDAKHLFGTAHRATMFGAGVTIGIGRKRPVLHYLYDAGLSFAAFTVGFHSIYSFDFQ